MTERKNRIDGGIDSVKPETASVLSATAETVTHTTY